MKHGTPNSLPSARVGLALPFLWKHQYQGLTLDRMVLSSQRRPHVSKRR